MTGLTPNMQILTDRGYTPISQLINTPFNIIVDGKTYPCDGFKSSGLHQTYTVELSNGLKFNAAAEQKFTNLLQQYVNVTDLKPQQWLNRHNPTEDNPFFKALVPSQVKSVTQNPNPVEVYYCITPCKQYICNGLITYN